MENLWNFGEKAVEFQWRIHAISIRKSKNLWNFSGKFVESFDICFKKVFNVLQKFLYFYVDFHNFSGISIIFSRIPIIFREFSYTNSSSNSCNLIRIFPINTNQEKLSELKKKIKCSLLATVIKNDENPMKK